MEKIKTNKKIYLLVLVLALCLIFSVLLLLSHLATSQKQSPTVSSIEEAVSTANQVFTPPTPTPNQSAEIDIGGTMYPVTFLGRLGNNLLSVDAGFEIEIFGSTIMSASQTGVASYRFSHFEIYKGSGYYVLSNGLVLDASYINTQSEIEIVGVYINISTMTVNIPRDYQSMGSYAVYLKDDITEALTKMYPTDGDTFVFDTGTTIILQALPNRFHSFREFKQNYKSELIENDRTRLQIKLLIDRELTLYFEKIIYTVQETIAPASQELVTISTDTMKLGDDVFISVDISSFYKIKDFKINGLSVNRETYAGDVRFAGNVATIKITEDWLQGYGSVLDIEVTTELNEIFLIIILCVSVTIPFFVMLLITLIVIGKHQRKVLHVQIQGKRTKDQRMNTGDFVRGLQDGSIGSLSDKTLQEKIDKMKQYEE
ncbi:MAG: hypothetical protein LBN07_04450 [Christensenellaceae bacterium]|jgi:hypothetical protein|nr:hypothetical protein [Christensenellaceae bacterium]